MIALSNISGDVTERYSYSAFGEPTVHGGLLNKSSVGNPYMFTARRYDFESGLYYYRARMYSPKLGRFLQPDPIGYYDSMNLYQYCGNNPINRIDPLGLNWFTNAAKAVGRFFKGLWEGTKYQVPGSDAAAAADALAETAKAAGSIHKRNAAGK